MIVQFIA